MKWLCSIVLVAACESSSAPPPPPKPAPPSIVMPPDKEVKVNTPAPPLQAPELAVEGPGQVTLVSPGKAPLTLLRLAKPVGAKGRLEMNVTPTKLGDAPSQRPPWTVTVEATIDSVEPSGGMHQSMKVVAPQVDGDAASPFARALASIENMVLHVVLAPEGGVSQVKVDLPPGPDLPEREAIVEGVVSSLSAQVIRLPKEPVGPGAVWTSTAELSILGLKTTRTVKVTLLSLEGHIMHCKLESLTQAAPGQSVTLRGQEVTFEKYTITTTATADVDLVGYDSAIKGHTVTSLAFARGKLRMTKDSEQDVVIKAAR